ncbi:MAG: hypothetical protein AB3N14_15550 [Flavobacteriaceae bacterium]
MLHQPTDNLIATLELDIGKIWFYPNLVISEMNEGVVVTFDNCMPIFMQGLEYYTVDTPLVYISHRKNSYSFDPTLHLEAKSIFSNLKGYGVVIYNEMNHRIARLEQNFMDCPVRIFYDLDLAKSWAKELLIAEGLPH